MKKIYTLVLALVAGGSTFAQDGIKPLMNNMGNTTYLSNPIVGQPKSIASGEDTLGLSDFIDAFNANEVGLNGVIGGGYVFGSSHTEGVVQGQNFYQDNVGVCRIYPAFDAPYYLNGVMMIVPFKYSTNGAASTSKLVISAYSLADNKALYSSSSTAADTTGPNTMLGSVDIPYLDIDTTIPQIVSFDTDPYIENDFAIVADFQTFATNGDSIAFPADQTSNGLGNNLIKIQQGLVGGNPLLTAWVYGGAIFQSYTEKDLALFPIVSDAPTAIAKPGFLDGLRMTQTYPNPAVDKATISIELQNAAKNVSLTVMDMSGKTLSTQAMENLAAGSHNFELNVSNLVSGNYLYMLRADGHVMVKKMSIVK